MLNDVFGNGIQESQLLGDIIQEIMEQILLLLSEEFFTTLLMKALQEMGITESTITSTIRGKHMQSAHSEHRNCKAVHEMYGEEQQDLQIRLI